MNGHSYLEQVGVSERRAQAEDVVSFRVLGDGLHDGAIHDDQVFGRGLDTPTFSRVARVEEEGRTLQAHPVAFPAALAGQFDLKEEKKEMTVRKSSQVHRKVAARNRSEMTKKSGFLKFRTKGFSLYPYIVHVMFGFD